ncbi:MAG TPA: hypothetical protein VFV73_11025 [Streptosporangiaceae bacterium]|nr:hypothetical protein [Streptosporangiaceae bacterium]
MNRLRARPLRPPAALRCAGRVLAAACAAMTLAGCGSQVAGRTTGHAQTASTTSHAVSPRQRAVADAARIIADFRRPPGTARSGPIASLSNPAVGIGTSDVATATRWWRVPGQPRAVLSWVRAHLPAGFTPDGSGSGTFRNSSGALVESQGDVFMLPPVPGVLPQRQLVVTAMPYRGQTALRTDAQVEWLPARPAAERIPPGVRAVTVTPVFGLNQDPRGDRLDHAFTVTDPAAVAKIIALADELTVFPPGARACPASFGGAMRLAFLTRPGGQVLATFTAEYGGCGSVSVVVRGKNQPALSTYTTSGPLVQDRILAIAGVRWPHQPGAPAGIGN